MKGNVPGNVRGTRHPIIITRDDKGTMIILDKMNHVGNLLKSIIVRGSVPACAMIVTAADCQIRSGRRWLNLSFMVEIPVKADNEDDC